MTHNFPRRTDRYKFDHTLHSDCVEVRLNQQGCCQTSPPFLNTGQKTPTVIEVRKTAHSVCGSSFSKCASLGQYSNCTQTESYCVSPSTSQRITDLSQCLQSELGRLSNGSESRKYRTRPKSSERDTISVGSGYDEDSRLMERLLSDKMSGRSTDGEESRFAERVLWSTIPAKSVDGGTQTPGVSPRAWGQMKPDKGSQTANLWNVKLSTDTASQATFETSTRSIGSQTSLWRTRVRDLGTQTVLLRDKTKPEFVFCPPRRSRPDCVPVQVVPEVRTRSKRKRQPVTFCSCENCHLSPKSCECYERKVEHCHRSPKSYDCYESKVENCHRSPKAYDCYESKVENCHRSPKSYDCYETKSDYSDRSQCASCEGYYDVSSPYRPYRAMMDEVPLRLSRPYARDELCSWRESRPYFQTMSGTETESECLDYYNLYVED